MAGLVIPGRSGPTPTPAGRPASGGVSSSISRLEPALVVLTMVAYLLLYSTLAILRHRTYHSFGLDLGLFDQVYWNTSQGRFFESTLSFGGPAPHSFFGDHFSPIHLLLMPFYLAWPHPETLLVLQTVALAAGAWPVYLLARAKLDAGIQRLTFVLAYFLALPVAFVNLYDFHETAFSIVPLGLALHFLETRRNRAFLAALAVTFLVKEEMPLVGAAFGLYALAKRRPALGAGVVAASALAFAVVVGEVIPHFAGGRPYTYFASRYGDLGATPLEMLRTIVTQPVRLARVLLQTKKVFFVVAMFGPTLFLTVLSGWAAMVVLPTLAYLLLSSYPPQFSFADQYAAPLVPLVVGTAILGLARVAPRRRSAVAGMVLLASLTASVLFGDLPISAHFNWRLFTVESRYAPFVERLRQIAPEASVSAEDGLLAHLSERRLVGAYRYVDTAGAEWVVLDWAAVDHDRARHEAEVTAVVAQGYEVVARGEGLALLRRGARAAGLPAT